MAVSNGVRLGQRHHLVGNLGWRRVGDEGTAP
jgi:hypothetical protein